MRLRGAMVIAYLMDAAVVNTLFRSVHVTKSTKARGTARGHRVTVWGGGAFYVTSVWG